MSILTQTIADEVRAVRTGVGLWRRTDHTFVRITGADADAWLHSQTSNDVEALQSGQGNHNAVLDRQGRLQGHFTVHRWEDEYWMIIETAQADHVLTTLDAHLFIEDVQLEPTGDALDQIVVQGPRALAFLAAVMDTDQGVHSANLPAAPWGVHPVLLAGKELLAFRLSISGEDGYVFIGEQGEGTAALEALLDAQSDFHPQVITPEAREILRIEAGLPQFGVDMDTRSLLPETTLERTAVSYEKGCYTGQEVVARLRAYGSVKQALMGLEIHTLGREPAKSNRGMGGSPMDKNNLARGAQAPNATDQDATHQRPFNTETTLPNRGMGGSPMDETDLARNAQAPITSPSDSITQKQGAYLPHWFKDHATYFVTYRLHDSLPKEIIAEKKEMNWEEYDHWIHEHQQDSELQNPEVAEIVQESFLRFHNERYFLFAWCIMPNHVHVVVKPEANHTLSEIIHTWKSYTSHEINRLLGRKGSLWQSEYYDKLVQDEDHLIRFIEYTYENAEQTGIHDWKWRGYHNPLDYFEKDSASTHGLEAHAPIGDESSLSLLDDVETSEIFIDDKRVGRITSTCQSPTLDAPIALAYLDREHRAPGERLTFTAGPDGPAFEATVRVLPFYDAPSREDRAQSLYDQALDLFQQDLDDTDASAISLLKEAILLHPTFEDAYEVLGVILHRHHRVDEAIHYMRHLVDLNPDCLMAHTNLSVFYLAKGMIDEAEQEKALSAVLGMKHATSEREAKELAEQERQRIKQEAEERIAMFEEVLEIDPDDPVATFGLGKAYVQLGEYEKAIPHLQHATEVQKDFSAAYLDLGKCHEFLGHPDTARAAYTEGIAVASRKGDLMPLREMERRLNAITP